MRIVEAPVIGILVLHFGYSGKSIHASEKRDAFARVK
jgi:hypothetical protein